jgi:hypothetical protein
MFQVPRLVPGAAYPKPFSLPAGVEAIFFSLNFYRRTPRMAG